MGEQLLLKSGQYMGSVVENCYADGIIAGATTYAMDAPTHHMHSHDNAHLSFVLRGGSAEKRVGSAYERLPGDIMFYHSGELHQNIQKLFPSKNINLEIENDWLKKHGISEAMIAGAISQHPDGKFIMLNMYKEMMAADNDSAVAIQMLFFDLVDNSRRKSANAKMPSWIVKVNELMADRWNDQVTLNDLAQATGVSPITISKHFHRYFACTFGEYRRKLKVERALYLLKAFDRTLTEVAYECKFSDQSHFTRTFKALTGFLPKAYRKL